VRIGVIGCGAIGSVIINAARQQGFAEVAALFDKCVDRAQKLAGKAFVARSFEEFIDIDMDVVVEAASQQAVEIYAEKILEKANLMLMSTGAFANDELLDRIENAAKLNNRKIYLPSGAVAGLDAIKSVSHLAKEVVLTTKKNPSSLASAPFFDVYSMNPNEIKEEKLLFEGSAREAIKLFPQNINVAAAVSLAGIGFDRTKVRIIADPKLKRNVHEVRVRGDFGEIVTVTKNVPSPQNPKTSYLAALSAVRTLKNIEQRIVIGT
jgi:aspartate dehydrogenase